MRYLENSDQAAIVKGTMTVDASPRGNNLDNQAPEGILVSDVAEGVASLPPLEREVLILSEYEGLELDDIAAIVGTDVRTVATRLEGARRRLRNVLANHLHS